MSPRRMCEERQRVSCTSTPTLVVTTPAHQHRYRYTVMLSCYSTYLQRLVYVRGCCRVLILNKGYDTLACWGPLELPVVLG